MPYVNESSSDPDRIFTVARTGTSSGSASFPNGRHRTQYGYRSIDLTQEQIAGIEAGPSQSWNMLSHINLLDETSGDLGDIGYRYHDMRYWPSHDRDFNDISYKPSGFNVRQHYVRKPTIDTVYSMQGAIGFIGVTTGYLPDDPSTSASQSIAGSMLRGNRPLVQNFNLLRSVAEQKDLELMMKVRNYIPRSPKDLGGAILNFLFGLKPTAEDLGNAAALCLKTAPAVSELIAMEKVRERRSSERTLFSDSASGSQRLTSFDTSIAGTTMYFGNGKVRIIYPGAFGTSGNYGNVLNPIISYSWRKTQRIRTYATWEYFVPRPLGLEERMSAYRLAATNLLETFKLEPSVVYDLTPWSWLVNWFFDFGGLLRYQQAVSQNNMVMTCSGYSILSDYFGEVTLSGYIPTANNGTYPYYMGEVTSFMPTSATVIARRVTRRSSSPYAVGPTWDFSLQQWGILGALGLAKGPNMPNVIR